MKKNSSLFFMILFLLSGGLATAQVFTPIDINPGADNSTPYNETSFQGKVYFSAYTPATGIELWVSDGTSAGTQMFKDLVPGPGSSYPSTFKVCNNELFFVASDSIHGTELWITDGTSAGTHMVIDAYPGGNSSSPGSLTVFNNKLCYTAKDPLHGYELWVSDGTSTGTGMIKDIYPGISDGSPEGLTANAQTGLSGQFNEFNGNLYFRANDGVHGKELWETDGTSIGTMMVVDLLPGPGGGRAYCMTAYNGKMLFGATDSVHGYELWTSDGTAAGTSLLKDIDPGLAGGEPASLGGFVLLNNKLYFNAHQAATGYELWVTDGTSAGTTLVKDIRPGPGSSAAGWTGIALLNDRLYFGANDSVNGRQLWTSDGTDAGTSMVKMLSATPAIDAYPGAFLPYNGQLLFVACVSSSTDAELWASDGTSANTRIIAPAIAPNTAPLTSAEYGYAMCQNNGSIFFTADYNGLGNELWIYHTPGTAITEAGAASGISAYPNPFEDAISLTGLADAGTYTVIITDIAGREIYNSPLEVSGGKASIKAPVLGAGAYLVHISGSSTTQTFKMIKQ
ncbi:MAG: T9SS type A sorting domain-containing protein [Bacteroidetes bacterium]|nr:T9SS type A sorting domain-containing protein [Bacteroidota bacterium]